MNINAILSLVAKIKRAKSENKLPMRIAEDDPKLINAVARRFSGSNISHSKDPDGGTWWFIRGKRTRP